MSLFPLRPLQAKALDGLKASLRGGKRRPILQMPTGAGKTVIGAHIVDGALDKRKRVAFVVPLLNLIDQTFERFVENGIDPSDMGVMQGDHPWRRASAPVQICSIQTVGSRGFPICDVAIIDEVHLRFKAIDRWIRERRETIFIGLSATPWSKGLKELWDDLVVPTSIKELISDGYLSPFRVFCPTHPDLNGIKIVAGDYHEGQLSERMSKATVVGDVVRNWIEKADRRPTLVFAVDRAHAQVLHDQFEREGVASAYVDCNTPREERGEMGRQLSEGKIEVICSVGTMTHGVDLDIRCIVQARPTKSRILFVQMMGRGLRTAQGKQDCLIFDHSNTHLELGLVTDISHNELKPAGKTNVVDRPTPLPKECPKCGRLIPPMAPECPGCGYRPQRRPSVSNIEGELIDFETARKSKRKDNREWTIVEKENFYGELRWYAASRDFREGWAANKYRERFGVWPNDPRVKYARHADPSPATLSWIKASQIRWAKSKERRETDERDSLGEI